MTLQLRVAIRRLAFSSAQLVILASLLLVACSDDGPNRPSRVTTTIADSLVFFQEDSTVVPMGTTPLVCCGLFDPSFVNEQAIRLVMYDPAFQIGGWQIVILIDRVRPDTTFTLPLNTIAPSKVPPVEIYVTTPGNEVSSETEESAGTITVHSFRCDATKIEIDFSVDATLGSEFGDGPTLGVRGSFRGTFPKSNCPE